MIVAEAAVLGAISQAIGLILGLLLSLILIYVVNVQSFGWTIQFHLPWAFFVQSAVLLVGASALAAWYPARRAGKLATVHEE
jgi:putative ABC transport system permease protein